MPAFYNSPVEFRKETVWYHTIIDDWASFILKFDPETNPYYKAAFESTRYNAQESKDRFLVSLPELGTATDDLSLMRGMQNLLF